jgi:hypothetical protein
MPLWEDYEVAVTISYEVRSAGKFICSGMTPGDGRGTSNREVKGLTMEEALQEAIGQAEDRARVAVRASEALRRKELGYGD